MDKIESPCIKQCQLNDDNICRGCFRHIDEIVQWGRCSIDQKKQIIHNSKVRVQAFKEAFRSG